MSSTILVNVEMLKQQEERVPSSFEPTVGWKATAVDKFCCTPNSKAHDAHMPTRKEDGTAPVRTFGTHFEQLWCASNSWMCAVHTERRAREMLRVLGSQTVGGDGDAPSIFPLLPLLPRGARLQAIDAVDNAAAWCRRLANLRSTCTPSAIR